MVEMQSTTAAPEKDPSARKRPSLRIPAGLAVVVVVLLALYYGLFVRGRVATDNAYVVADSATVSARVAGNILTVRVRNDDAVQAGDLLLELDDRDLRAVADKHRAALARTEAEIEVAEVTVKLTESQTLAQAQAAEAMLKAAVDREKESRHRLEEQQQVRTAAEADSSHARRDMERYSALLQSGAGSEQQRDRTSTAFKKSKAQLDAAQAQIAAARAALDAALQDVDRARAQLDSARADELRVEIEKSRLAALRAKWGEIEAELRLAELNLSYSAIKAPIAGYIAQSHIQVGDRVLPGQALFAIIPLDEVYVEANLKETQLENVRIGQKVRIEADIYPGHAYGGSVVGIRAGTGAAFSLLPPENATGNWIKVVQRVPVKIRLESPPPPEYPLRVGSSLKVSIDTGDRSGARLASTGGRGGARPPGDRKVEGR
ncbi:MAG: HlyD family secretion protein [Syntrophobacteraceae bacterium]|jgi:membrane fusion protein (multidrug efflux system)|nr:HlyD family secretion protein [Syntrophobacteraceae bacterium]